MGGWVVGGGVCGGVPAFCARPLSSTNGPKRDGQKKAAAATAAAAASQPRVPAAPSICTAVLDGAANHVESTATSALHRLHLLRAVVPLPR